MSTSLVGSTGVVVMSKGSHLDQAWNLRLAKIRQILNNGTLARAVTIPRSIIISLISKI
jgi:hypothetical protein